MPIRLTPEEIARDYGGHARLAEEPEAGWGTRFGAAADRFQAALLGVGEAVTGSETLGRMRRENQAASEVNRARAVRDTGTVDSYKDIAGPGDLAGYVGGLAVDSSPELLTTLLSGGLGGLAGLGTAGRIGLAAATSAPSAMGDILQNQRQEAGKTDLLSASLLTAPYVAVDMVGLDAALASGRMARSGIAALDNLPGARGIAARGAATFAKSAPAQGFSEVGQEFVNQAGRIAVNPDQTFFNPDANERYAESFAGGALLGGVVSTGLGGWRRTNEPATAQPAQEAPARVIPQLGFDPRAGQQTVFPDGSSIVSSEVEPLQTGAAEVTQVLESHKAAQAQREAAAAQAAVPPTPEQIEEEAAAQAQVQLTQDAVAYVQQAGIQAKNALPVVKEMLASPDVVTPALRGAMRGALVTGDVNGARKMLVDAKKAKQKAEAEAIKADEKARAEALRAQEQARKKEEKIVADGLKAEKANDDFAASVVAARTQPTQGAAANVPSPAQPGTQTSQAQSAQGQTASATQPVATTQPVVTTQPAQEVSPGNAIVNGLEERFGGGKKMSPMARKRLFALVGFDEAGYPTAAGRKTLDEVAASESKAGKASSRQAVQKMLKPFGVSDAMVNAIADFDFGSVGRDTSAPDVAASFDTVVDESTGSETIVERETPEDSTRGLVEGDFDSAGNKTTVVDMGFGEDSSDSKTGMRVRSNLGEGVVEDASMRSAPIYSLIDLATHELETGGHTDGVAEAMGKLANMLPEKWERTWTNPKTLEVNVRPLPEGVVAAAKRIGNKIASHFYALGDMPRAAAFSSGRLRDAIDSRMDAAADAKERASEEAKAAEAARAAENARIASENEKLIAQFNEQLERGNVLNRELGHPDLINEAPRAAEEWASIGVPEDGDLNWDQLPPKQQAAWVRAFVRWDNGVDNDSAYYRNFAEINDAARKATLDTASKTGTGTRPDNAGAVGQGTEAGQNTASRAAGSTGSDQPTAVRDGDTGQEGPGAGVGGNPRFIYAGALATTADNATRAEAERRLTAGEDPEVVRKETGWFKGKYDGKLRFELNDSEAQWVTSFEKIPESKLFEKATPLKLGDVLQHDALFAAYPELRDIAFVKRSGFLDFGGLQGSFDPKTMTLQVTPYAENPLSTALHEIQHWIQTKEGFEPGGNESLAMQAMSDEQIARIASQIIQEQTEVVAKAAKTAELLAKIGNLPELKAFWEANERFTKAAREHEVPGHPARKAAYAELTMAKSAFRKAAFGKDGYLDMTLDERLVEGRADTEAGFNRAGDDAVKAIMDGTSKIADVRSGDIDRLRAVLKSSSLAYDAYRRIAGEIEARDVQSRQGMTDAQRKETAPFSSEDIAVEDAVLASRSENGATTSESRTRNVVTIGNIKDSVGKQVAAIEGTREDMERTPHIKAAFDKLRANGLGSVVDSIESWYVTENPVDWGGAYTVINGKTAIVMTSHDMLVPSAGEYTMLHELGHAADKTHEDGGGLYSGMPEFNLRIVGNQIRGHGIVADQVIAFYESNPKSWFSKRMQYPLDRKAHGDLDAQGVREEMFAQLHATFNTPVGKEFLYDNLPDVAYFLENVNADIAQNDTTAEGLAGATTTGAPSRFSQAKRGQETQGPGVLATRPQGDRGQRASQVTRFNRTRNIEDQLTPAARAAAGATKQFLKDVKDKSVLWGAFTEDLISSISGKLPAAKKYLDLVKRAQVEKTRAEREIESILDRFNSLSKVERGTGPSSVNAFLKDSTTKKLWGYVPEYLDNVQVDPEMEARFNALLPAAQSLVRAVFKHGHDNLQKLKSAVMGNINTEFDALIAAYEAAGDKKAADKERMAKQKALRDFQSLTALSGDWPYAPLKRFGNHVVVGKSQAYLDAEEAEDSRLIEKMRADENHYFVSFTETKREARALREKIAARYADATNFEKDGVEYGSRDMLGAFRRLRTLVDDSKDDKLSGNAKRAMNRLMVDLHLTLLGEQSARQAERIRTGVAGADEDMMRAFATQGRASAHFIASLTNNGQIADELRNLRNQADSFRGAEREGARDAYNEVLRRHAMGIDYQPTPFIDKALGANSVWMLLTSPAYFLTNATQPFTTSVPMLAGRNGYTRSFAAMSKAYADIAPLIKDGTITQDDYSRMPADVKGIIEELANRGRIDISLEQDLGRWRSDQQGKLAVFNKVVDKMRGVAQTVESVNRVATAIAAARLAKQNGMTDADATKYADEVIFTTHGDYSGFNAPRVMRSGIGRMMTQFRKFQLIQISMHAKLLNSALKGATPEERLVARRVLAYSLTHMFILGGALGMPGAQAIGWVLRQVFGDDDEPDNPEVTLRKLVPPELADLLVKGAPAALGVDLSGRLGAGNMLSLLPYADLELSRDGYQSVAMAAMGPFFGGLLPKFADGLGLINKGDYWKGLEQLAPKGLSDVSKAVRQSTEGITQRNGDIAMSADEVSFLASIGQAMGLPTTSLTERSMIANAKFKADEFFNQRTAQIKKEYVQAYRSGDNEALVEAREEWARTQEARKEYGYKVQPLSELLKAPQAQVKREANRAGGVPYKKGNEQFVRSMTQ